MLLENDLIKDNIRAENKSFLYYLHEENVFDKQSLADLCHYIEKALVIRSYIVFDQIIF